MVQRRSEHHGMRSVMVAHLVTAPNMVTLSTGGERDGHLELTTTEVEHPNGEFSS